LTAEQTNPPVPRQLESTPAGPHVDQLWQRPWRATGLKAMEADVRRAEASLRLALQGARAGFQRWAGSDAKASPVIYSHNCASRCPSGAIRCGGDCGRAGGPTGQPRRGSPRAIALAVALAEKSFMFPRVQPHPRIADRAASAKAWQSSTSPRRLPLRPVDFLNLIDAEPHVLGFQLTEVEARIQRELALAELSLLILVQPGRRAPPVLPANSPGPATKPSRRNGP